MNLVLIGIRNLLYMFLFILFWWWVAMEVRSFDDELLISLPPSTRLGGIGIMIVGTITALACAGAFILVGRGTAAPFDAPQVFVCIGPYLYVRNPMYIGGFFILVGFALFERSASILLFCPLWLLLAHVFVVFYEEPTLEQRFGKSYMDYRQAVNRWLPKLRPYRPT